MALLQRKLYFSKDPEGVQLFPGEGSNFFPVGVQMLISIEITHITCNFPGGGGGFRTPCPPPSGSAFEGTKGFRPSLPLVIKKSLFCLF